MTTQEVIKSLRMIKSTCYIGNRMFLDALEQAVEMLEAQKWIPCAERLPEKPENYPNCETRRIYYLVSLESGCVKALAYEFDRDEWQHTGSPVVAWMPLPEPYKEGGAV